MAAAPHGSNSLAGRPTSHPWHPTVRRRFAGDFLDDTSRPSCPTMTNGDKLPQSSGVEGTPCDTKMKNRLTASRRLG